MLPALALPTSGTVRSPARSYLLGQTLHVTMLVHGDHAAPTLTLQLFGFADHEAGRAAMIETGGKLLSGVQFFFSDARGRTVDRCELMQRTHWMVEATFRYEHTSGTDLMNMFCGAVLEVNGDTFTGRPLTSDGWGGWVFSL